MIKLHVHYGKYLADIGYAKITYAYTPHPNSQINIYYE